MDPIKKLSHRHHRLALLVASGAPTTEVAQGTGYSNGRVAQLRTDPQITELIEQYRQQFFASAAASLAQDLQLDATHTFKRLKEIRDDADPEIAIKGCIPLWDRQVPKRTIHDEDRTVRIIISREDKARLTQVVEEADTIDAEYALLEGQAGG